MISYRGDESIDWFGFNQLWSHTVGYAITTSRIDSLNQRKTLRENLALAGFFFVKRNACSWMRRFSLKKRSAPLRLLSEHGILILQKNIAGGTVLDYFLIDFENMPISDGTYLEEMHTGDVVIIFYSDMCNEISLDLLEAADRLNIEFHYQKANIGTKNALDFQLSSYLGYLIGKGTPNARYHIVSKDKGYDCLCNYWRSQNIPVDRITFAKPDTFLIDGISIIPITGEPQYQKPSVLSTASARDTSKKKKEKKKKKSSKQCSLAEIEAVLSDDAPSEALLAIVNRCKSRAEIHIALSKKFRDSKQAGAVYKKLKPLLKAKGKK